MTRPRVLSDGSDEPFTATTLGANGGTTPEPASRDCGPDGPRYPPTPDDSIQIHVCHSPVREAEVLHDRLLALFDAHRDLEPADVLVLTPDLEIYGPAIEAVFAAAGRIPCNVARAQAMESRTMRAFLDLLSLARSRYGAEAVCAPLAAPAVRIRFGIGEADLAIIRGVVREAGIRWGVDEAHRVREGLPETAEHTWRQGLRRLPARLRDGECERADSRCRALPALGCRIRRWRSRRRATRAVRLVLRRGVRTP